MASAVLKRLPSVSVESNTVKLRSQKMVCIRSRSLYIARLVAVLRTGPVPFTSHPIETFVPTRPLGIAGNYTALDAHH